MYKTIVILLSFILIPLGATAAFLHAIIIADTEDPYIDVSCLIDLSNIRAQLRTISHYSSLELKETILEGSLISTNKIWQTINSLNIDKDDVIFFYYSGHGFRSHEKDDYSPWPILSCQSKNNSELWLDDIIEVLTDYQGRLTIIFSDCCNQYPEYAENISQEKLIKAIANQGLLRKNYHRLFMETYGVIISTSSSSGESSTGDFKNGGWHTYTFLTTLAEKMCSTKDSSWQEIFDNSSQKLVKHIDYYNSRYPNSTSRNQTPITFLEIYKLNNKRLIKI